MLIPLAAFLAAVAILAFAYQAKKENWDNFTTIGLGLLSGGFLCFLLDILHSQGKI